MPTPRECPAPGCPAPGPGPRPAPPLAAPPRAWRPAGDGQWCFRVTQLLERLNRVVEEGNLFDPARPSLGSELEALRQHLEALSASPDPWDSRAARPAGVPGGRAVPEPAVSGHWGLKPGSGASCRGLHAHTPARRSPGACCPHGGQPQWELLGAQL